MKNDQDPLIANALAQGCTQGEAGRRAGVSERTVRRRLMEPAFRDKVVDARDQLIKETADRFTSLQASALDAIETALTDPRAETRLRAAKMILDIGGQYRDRVELEARLQAVEAGTSDPNSTPHSFGERRPEAAKNGQITTGGKVMDRAEHGDS